MLPNIDWKEPHLVTANPTAMLGPQVLSWQNFEGSFASRLSPKKAATAEFVIKNLQCTGLAVEARNLEYYLRLQPRMSLEVVLEIPRTKALAWHWKRGRRYYLNLRLQPRKSHEVAQEICRTSVKRKSPLWSKLPPEEAEITRLRRSPMEVAGRPGHKAGMMNPLLKKKTQALHQQARQTLFSHLLRDHM